MSSQELATISTPPAPEPTPTARQLMAVPAEGAAQNLAHRIATYTQRGYLVQSQTPTQLVLVRPKTKINHLLHFFLSLFSAGIWIFGWIFVSISKKRTKSVILHVNPDGSIVEQKV